MRSLVIGYGSPLRGDDAVGLHVADAVHDRKLPDVDVRAVHQLTPELSLYCGACDLVVFVDADVEVTEVTVRRVQPLDAPPRTTHHLRPEVLLSFTAMLGLPVPRAYAVAVPVEELGLSLDLSAAAIGHVRDAVAAVVDCVNAPV